MSSGDGIELQTKYAKYTALKEVYETLLRYKLIEITLKKKTENTPWRLRMQTATWKRAKRSRFS